MTAVVSNINVLLTATLQAVLLELGQLSPIDCHGCWIVARFHGSRSSFTHHPVKGVSTTVQRHLIVA